MALVILASTRKTVQTGCPEARFGIRRDSARNGRNPDSASQKLRATPRIDTANSAGSAYAAKGRYGGTSPELAFDEQGERRRAVLLDDINVNLEMLGEQRAAIDHVGEKLAHLDFMVQEAQNTLGALQRDREMAERIEQGIKSLRARSGDARSA